MNLYGLDGPVITVIVIMRMVIGLDWILVWWFWILAWGWGRLHLSWFFCGNWLVINQRFRANRVLDGVAATAAAVQLTAETILRRDAVICH